MTQIVRATSLSRFEAVEIPLLGSPATLIAKPLNGHIIEAIPCVVDDDASDYVKAYYAGRWLVVERDPSLNLIRESTGSYANERAAYYAYWHATEEDPLDFESWVVPMWSLSVATQEAA